MCQSNSRCGCPCAAGVGFVLDSALESTNDDLQIVAKFGRVCVQKINVVDVAIVFLSQRASLFGVVSAVIYHQVRRSGVEQPTFLDLLDLIDIDHRDCDRVIGIDRGVVDAVDCRKALLVAADTQIVGVANDAPTAVAAHCRLAAVGVEISHRKVKPLVGFAQHHQSVGTYAEMSVADGCNLLSVKALGLIYASVYEHKVVACALVFDEFDFHKWNKFTTFVDIYNSEHKIMVEAIKEHRSIRKFVERKQIPKQLMDRLLEAATRASTTGGMQLYSIIVSQSREVKEQLAPLHFNQPMVAASSAVVTFCADVARFSRWCELRGAEPGYNNFAWFINAAIDTLLTSENFALEAESEGLGICYLGTTIYTTDKLIEVLDLPRGVIPITTIVVGYPEIVPPKTDRLPVEAVVHSERYEHPTDAQIEEFYAPTEASEQTAELLKANGLSNLAQIFTERRYKKTDNEAISASYMEVLKKQGFLD